MKTVRKVFDVLSLALMGAVMVCGVAFMQWGLAGLGFLGMSLGVRVLILADRVDDQRTAQHYLLTSVRDALDHPRTRAAMKKAVDEAKEFGRAQAAEMAG